MMSLTFSVICLALIVCCSNFVFTADCEIHSCEATTHTGYCDGRVGWAGLEDERGRTNMRRRRGPTEAEIDACYCLELRGKEIKWAKEGKERRGQKQQQQQQVVYLVSQEPIWHKVTVSGVSVTPRQKHKHKSTVFS